MRIFIAGDSTASIKEKHARPETGWGEKLSLYFNKKIEIINGAQNGRSTKTFIEEGRLLDIEKEIKVGDYLIVQFGHNDEKVDYPERYASPKVYKRNLKLFIEVARNNGATPIIFSSVSRRRFLEDKKTIDPSAIGKYPSYAKEVAEEQNILFIDMFQKSKELYEYLGFELSKKLFLKFKANEHPNYPNGIDDDTHFNDFGAKVIASMVAEELAKLNSPINMIIEKNKLLSFPNIKDTCFKL